MFKLPRGDVECRVQKVNFFIIAICYLEDKGRRWLGSGNSFQIGLMGLQLRSIITVESPIQRETELSEKFEVDFILDKVIGRPHTDVLI